MNHMQKFAAVAAVATLALIATDLSASAQSSLTNGPTGSDDGMPSRATVRHKAPRSEGRSANSGAGVPYASRRPLTVRRTAAAGEAPAAVPAPAVNTGPGTLITGPLGFASNVLVLPFRAVNGVFPATGDVGSNPLVIIGAPVHAVGDIVQFPLRVIGAPFGGTTIATY